MAIRKVTLPWESLNNGAYQAGGGATNLLRQLGAKARSTACTLYRDLPGALIPNPASNFLQGMWDSICYDDPAGLPPPPSPPFSGGQCRAEYVVDTSVVGQAYDCDGTPGLREENVYRKKVWGPIRGTQIEYDSPGNCGPTRFRAYLLHYQSPSDGEEEARTLLSSFTNNVDRYVEGSAVIISSYRDDGLADDCGDPPPEYSPPPGDYTPPSGNYDIQPRPDDSGWVIRLPFTWIDADLDLDIRPYIDVGGIKIDFDLGGINFYFDPDNAPIPLPDENPNPDNILPPPPQVEAPDIPDYEPRFDDIDIELDDIEDKIDNLPPPLVPCQEAEKEFVRVVADTSNYVGKVLFSDDDGEIVIFGGYIRFLIDGEPYGEEVPIRRLVSNFPMPDWANGYRLVPQNRIGLTGAIVKKTVPLPAVRMLDCSVVEGG